MAEIRTKGKSNLRLLDGGALVTLVLQHYEQLGSHYKGLIALTRVYVPAPSEESDEP